MIWLMKIADAEYRVWSTETESWVTEPLTRAQALEFEDIDAEMVAWVDKHLCSCRSRLGESFVKRNDRLVAVGGGALAYHFDTYAEVLGYCDPTRNRMPDDPF